jgi:hypothetical protein
VVSTYNSTKIQLFIRSKKKGISALLCLLNIDGSTVTLRALIILSYRYSVNTYTINTYDTNRNRLFQPKKGGKEDD